MKPATRPRQAIRRRMSWPARVLISVAIPLVFGAGIAATGFPRWLYNRAPQFWAITGLYNPTPVPVRVRLRPREAPPPLELHLRYITEGVMYAVLIAPTFVLAIFVYDRLTFRYTRDDEFRCVSCGHILKGLTEPRCPECGRRI
jgi:hypothetical protein